MRVPEKTLLLIVEIKIGMKRRAFHFGEGVTDFVRQGVDDVGDGRAGGQVRIIHEEVGDIRNAATVLQEEHAAVFAHVPVEVGRDLLNDLRGNPGCRGFDRRDLIDQDFVRIPALIPMKAQRVGP
jgi:hypothetical protein